jgi:ribosomal protein S27AE
VRLWKFPDQVIRLVIVFAVALGGLLAVRAHFVPKSFGRIGHYRADAVPAIAAQEIRYAGTPACLECHDDIAEAKAASYHRGLACEACHGPAAAHVNAPDEAHPHKPATREECLACHAYLASRPTGFPQVLPLTHNPNKMCTTCHDPHAPNPPETPQSCGACHATVARLKAVSHHASLECQTCHETPPEHFTAPRAHLPRKPADRAFCGQCHAQDAVTASTAPRVDMATHGERYVCWQCHYPHLPEGR